MTDELNEARALLGLPEIDLTDTVAIGQIVRARTLDELRNGVR